MQAQQFTHSFPSSSREKPKGITLSLSKNSILRSNYKKLEISQQQRLGTETSTKVISPFFSICFCQCYEDNYLRAAKNQSQLKESFDQQNEKSRSLLIPERIVNKLFIQTDFMQELECSNQSTPINRILYSESDDSDQSGSKLEIGKIKFKKQFIRMSTLKNQQRRCIDIGLLSTKNSQRKNLRSISIHNSDAKSQLQNFVVVSTEDSVNFSRNMKIF